MDEKLQTARLSIGSNILLTLGKLVIGLTMHSVGVLSESIHSGLDLVASIIAYFTVRESNKPADAKHLYGHGKMENLAGIIEALLIIVAAILILKEAIPKIWLQNNPVRSLDLGAAVMFFSALINYLVSNRLLQVGRRTDSAALEADGWHLRTDVYTSMGVFVGILAIRFTGLQILDSLIAIVVTLLIFKAAYELLRDSLGSMLDVKLPDEEEALIFAALEKYSAGFLEFHKVRTRKAGPQRHVDLHLVVPRRVSITEAHELCDRIEQEIQEQLAQTQVLIHVEPCRKDCSKCDKCRERM